MSRLIASPSRVAARPGPVVSSRVKRLEDPFAFVLGDTGAVIGDRELARVVGLVQATATVLDPLTFGVVEQVPQRAPELVGSATTWPADAMRVDRPAPSTQALRFAQRDVVEIDGSWRSSAVLASRRASSRRSSTRR